MKKILWFLMISLLISSCTSIWNQKKIEKEIESWTWTIITVDEWLSWINELKRKIVYEYSIRDEVWNLIYESKDQFLYDYDKNKFPITVKWKIVDLTVWQELEAEVRSEELFDWTKEEIEVDYLKYDKEHSILINKNNYVSTKEIKEDWEIIEDSTIWEWKFVVIWIDKASDMIRLAKRYKENPLVWYKLEDLKIWDEFYMSEFWVYFTIKDINLETKKIIWETYFNPYKWQKLKVELRRVA